MSLRIIMIRHMRLGISPRERLVHCGCASGGKFPLSSRAMLDSQRWPLNPSSINRAWGLAATGGVCLIIVVGGRKHADEQRNDQAWRGGRRPTGMLLAGKLAMAGIDVAVVERRARQDLVG
jgi:hypothetical protein